MAIKVRVNCQLADRRRPTASQSLCRPQPPTSLQNAEILRSLPRKTQNQITLVEKLRLQHLSLQTLRCSFPVGDIPHKTQEYELAIMWIRRNGQFDRKFYSTFAKSCELRSSSSAQDLHRSSERSRDRGGERLETEAGIVRSHSNAPVASIRVQPKGRLKRLHHSQSTIMPLEFITITASNAVSNMLPERICSGWFLQCDVHGELPSMKRVLEGSRPAS